MQMYVQFVSSENGLRKRISKADHSYLAIIGISSIARIPCHILYKLMYCRQNLLLPHREKHHI